VIGTFNRITKDTASVFPSVLLWNHERMEEESMFQRLLTPFILIGSTVVLVYLFFTVRS
jgi:hypothetical protein